MTLDDLNKDLELLTERGFAYELVEEGSRAFIVLKHYPLPSNIYNMESTDLLIFTTNLYPNSGFDMFWVDEKLTLKNGGIPRNADQIETYLGKKWRRFSYHPYNAKPWNPSEDSVASFIGYVNQRLNKGD